MKPDEQFRELLERVGQGDEDAIAELVRRYEPVIRGMVRAWLRPWEARLRKVFDSQDICQSVLAWFFLKNATQRYDLSSAENLQALLRVMVRNRVFYRMRQGKHQAASQPIPSELVGREVPPDEVVADRELLEALAERLSPEEAELVRLRMAGQTWQQISDAVGGTPDARRIQLARVASRLSRELSLAD